MKISVKEIIESESYAKEADLWAKGTIFVSFLVAIYVAVFTDMILGWHWIWVIPVLLFGSSLLLAMPTMYVQVMLASLLSRHCDHELGRSPRPRNGLGRLLMIIKNLWGLLVIPVEIWLVYEFLKYVASL